MAEQFIGILFEVQQIVHIHQHLLGLLTLRLLQLFFEHIEGADTVRAAIGYRKPLFQFNILLQVFVHRHTLPSIQLEFFHHGGLMFHTNLYFGILGQ